MKKLIMACIAWCIFAPHSKAQNIVLLKISKNGARVEKQVEDLMDLLQQNETKIDFSDPFQSEMLSRVQVDVEKHTHNVEYELSTVVQNTDGEKALIKIFAWVEGSTEVLRLSQIFVGYKIKYDTEPAEYANYYNVTRAHDAIDWPGDESHKGMKLDFYDVTSYVTCCPERVLFYENAIKNRMKVCVFQENKQVTCNQEYNYIDILAEQKTKN